MGNEWQRLAPDGSHGDVHARRDDTGAFVTYEIDDRYGVAILTVPEALAFARLLPEVEERERHVEALVEDARAIRDAIEANAAPYEPIYALKQVGRVTLEASLIIPLLQHLAPFKEASDANISL